MAAPETTMWERPEHTRAKHEILKRYLHAWTPILSGGQFPEVVYLDGFAGPGSYLGDAEGSPIIALQAALDQSFHSRSTIRFIFVEKSRSRARALGSRLGEISLPDNFKVDVISGETFEAAFGEIRESYARESGRWPPMFAFIDPFGWKGVPFSIVKEIMSHQNCEILVTFMYEEINRFVGHPDQEENFDAFFGTPDWRDHAEKSSPQERNDFLRGLYDRQLRDDAKAKYVRPFMMKNVRGRTDYYLYFATNNLLGLKKMKEAMWKVDESGGFRFSDATDPNQLTLFDEEPRFDVLERQILERFGGTVATVKEIEEFVLAETPFRETHYKRQILRPLERAEPPKIEAVDPPARRRIGTYRDESLRLRFL